MLRFSINSLAMITTNRGKDCRKEGIHMVQEILNFLTNIFIILVSLILTWLIMAKLTHHRR